LFFDNDESFFAMIITGHLLLPNGLTSVRLTPGWIRVDGSLITEVQAGEIHTAADHGDEHTIVSPGFVDLHLHLPQIDAFGAYGMRLLEWLQGAIFPSESAWQDPDHAEARCRSAIAQLHSVGTTSIFAFTSNHYESTRRCLKVCSEAGMRAFLGQPIADFDIVPGLCQPTEKNLLDTRLLLEEFPMLEGGRRCAAAAIGTRFALTSTPGLLHGSGELASEFQAFVATHLAENEPECERAVALHGGPDYTSIYQRAGLCTRRSFFGHCIHLSPSERKILADTDSVAVHCPTSNAFLRSGTMNRAQCMRDGIRVGLGSDIAAGYDKSMIRTARSMLEVTMYVREAPPPAAQAWWQMTAGNASLLGWESCGRIQEGAEADIVTLRPFHRWQDTLDPLSDVLWTWNDRWLTRTLVAGKTVFSHNEEVLH